MRLQVFISRSGFCSRRRALQYVQLGKVVVNGKEALEASLPVTEQDTIIVCGQKISKKKKSYVLLNKPKGVVVTVSDRFAQKSIMDLLPRDLKHLYPVGRLDKNTTGLILLTNDGDLTHRMMHPSFGMDKVYRVLIDKPLWSRHKEKLEQGISLDGKKTAPCQIVKKSDYLFEMTIHEGRKRQIREMFDLLEYHVKELCRIKQGFLTLNRLKPGQWRFLGDEEIKKLYRDLGLQPGKVS